MKDAEDAPGDDRGLLAIGYWLLAIGYWLLAIGYWQSIGSPSLVSSGIFDWLFGVRKRSSAELPLFEQAFRNRNSGRPKSRRKPAVFASVPKFLTALTVSPNSEGDGQAFPWHFATSFPS
jgi:hypothetical protein